METLNTLKNVRNEVSLFRRRAFVIFSCIVLGCLVLLGRLAYLQLAEHQRYSTLSKNNLLKVLPIEPNRGLILDRNGVVLAKNRAVFSLEVIPGRVPNLQSALKRLSRVITLNPDEIKNFYQRIKHHRRYDHVPIKIKLSKEQMAKFYVDQFKFPGFSVEPHMIRTYPHDKQYAEVIGYVGRINTRELQSVNAKNYSASNTIGKTGIEQYYEAPLHGKVGAAIAESDASGRIVRSLKRIPPIPGANLTLTLDSRLQDYAEKLMQHRQGALIALNPKNGEILAMVSQPNFDPNLFVSGISSESYRQLLHAPHHPLFNRLTRGLYAPGSVVKPFIGLASLQQHVISSGQVIHDPGWFQLPNTQHVYHDWHKSGHGWVNLKKAIMVSCDTYFYHLAVTLGIDRLAQSLRRFGFGTKTGVDIPHERGGIVPDPDWKLRMQHQKWYTGDTIITGIGQGSLLATPLQLANATAILANHGRRIHLHLLKSMSMAEGAISVTPIVEDTPLHFDEHHWKVILSGMRAVIDDPRGTAEAYGKHTGFTVAGKTGTAQVYGKQRDEERTRKNIPKHLRNNHLFISFAPIKQPKLVVIVVIEHASHADNIAGNLARYYFHSLLLKEGVSP